MENKTRLILRIALVVGMIASVIIFLYGIATFFGNFELKEVKAAMNQDGETPFDHLFDLVALNMNWGFALIGVACLSTLAVILKALVTNFRSSIKGLLGVIVLGLIALISFSVAGGSLDVNSLAYETLVKNEMNADQITGVVKFVDASLYFTYTILGLVGFSIIFSSVYKYTR